MKSKQRLGRGLGALLPSDNEAIEENFQKNGKIPDEGIAEIPVASIVANPYQPRLDFDPIALDELKRSIQEKGIIQPISVRKMEDGTFQLIAGERRLRAIREIGLEKVPAYILHVETNEDMLELALIENVQREYLNPIEMAVGYQRLIDECQLTQEEVAKKIGKDRTTITNFLRLLRLPAPIQDSLKQGEIMMGHARALLALSDEKEMIKLWKKAVKNKFSVRQVEKTVKQVLKSGQEDAPATAISKKRAVFVQRFENKLQEKFGTKVKIRTKRDGGSIEIEYYSKEDLNRLMEIFDEIKTF